MSGKERKWKGEWEMRERIDKKKEMWYNIINTNE